MQTMSVQAPQFERVGEDMIRLRFPFGPDWVIPASELARSGNPAGGILMPTAAIDPDDAGGTSDFDGTTAEIS
jgi:hypothetical protein